MAFSNAQLRRSGALDRNQSAWYYVSEPKSQGVRDREEAGHGWLVDHFEERVHLADGEDDGNLLMDTTSHAAG
ncbi:hypothetical protein SH449x_002180 [Pirellulaceae bacterium SH449]